MNMGKTSILKTARIACFYIACALAVGACGGGGGGSSSQSAGVGGTGITARGYVQGEATGFGSIYVNGKKFNTDDSSFIVDGESVPNQDLLEVGMVLTLEVETEDGNFTGKALQVVYDDEVEGPITSISVDASGTEITVSVLGQSIVISDTRTQFKNTSFEDLRDNGLDYIIEVSGFRVSPTAVNATFIEKTGVLMLGTTEVELRGNIENLSGGALPSFELNGVDISTDGDTEFDVPGGTLSEGLYVEVKGVIQTATSVLAEKIEHEDESFDDDVDDVSLQGVISDFNGIDDFKIDGLPVVTSGAKELSPANVLDLLDEGVEIEVEGNIVAGVLIAEEVELREGETELRTTVSAIALPDSFQVEYPGQPAGSGLGTVWIKVDAQTLFEDEDDSGGKTPVENFSIDLLMPGDFVKIEGIEESGEVTAQIVKRLEPGDSSKLQGAVDTFVRDVSITILGVLYPLDPGAKYYDKNGVEVPKDQFFDDLEANPEAIVELEDDEPDADADEIEFDD